MRLVHHAHTGAAPSLVWQLVADPAGWPAIYPLVRRVRGTPGPVVTGRHLVAVSRGWPLRIPVDVVEAAPEQRLSLLIHTAPGLREELTVELTPALQGGTDITVATIVDGFFAPFAAVSMWTGAGVTARLLSLRAGQAGRRQRADTSGAA